MNSQDQKHRNMSYDFSRLSVSSQQEQPIDPIEIFRGAAITDGDINDLWLGQGDALRDWNQHRNNNDVAVVLNTGAGKTLVGLLIAQSLVNETQRQVVYACSSIQLVEQTANKAQGYGLPVATYYQQKFLHRDLYYRAKAPCVTTYQALFNGKSRFQYDDIAAVILDDAHTADQILRDQFTLSITRKELPETFDKILVLFQPYHEAVNLATSYAQIVKGESSREFLVPPFEILSNLSELQRLLLQADLGRLTNTMFAWEHIRDHVDLCCLLISNSEIVITPPFVPAFSLSYFKKEVRRVYLSATLSASDSFVRAFGRQPDKKVSPPTTAGECERMILIPSMVEAIDDELASAKEVIRNHKALILVPSFARAEEWIDASSLPTKENAPEVIDSFRKADPPTKLTLAARYDGIDLPGDTCRMMVLDELPAGAGALERFQRNQLNMQNSLRSLLATRIVQSLGRISRGMSDHGVVLLTGKGLIEWIIVPRNQLLLPKFLQNQIKIGEEISKGTQSEDGLCSAAASCLERASNWIQFYTESMRNLPPQNNIIGQDKALEISLAEARFGRALWRRDYQSAARALDAILEVAFEFSRPSGEWLCLWLGYALELDGDRERAYDYYRRSYMSQPNMPRPAPDPSYYSATVPTQVIRVSEQMRVGSSGLVRVPLRLSQDLQFLSGGGSSGQVEEAMRCLGQYLGFVSTRPDHEFGTGPDVLWLADDVCAICIEVKSNKDSLVYRKAEVSQLHSHVQWVKDRHEDIEIIPIFVGPTLLASKDANPSVNMKVIELTQFEVLSQRIMSVLRDVAHVAVPLSLESELHSKMSQRSLMFPKVIADLESSSLRDT